MISILLSMSLFFLVNCAGKDVKNLPVQYSVFQKGSLYGYKDAKGKVVVPADYMKAEPFQNRVGYVADREKWMVLDSNGKVLFIPLTVEPNNMPDPFQEGLARFIQNGKIGFYDNTGRIVIPAQFTFAHPFEGGKARVCNDCKKETKKDHTEYVGKFFTIDKSGRDSTGGN